MRARAGFTIAVVVLLATGSATGQFVAKDPGVRNDASAAGKPLKGLSASQIAFFEAGKDDFAEAEIVADGLGPRFNLDSCAGCHIQPAIGGTSPRSNPQVPRGQSLRRPQQRALLHQGGWADPRGPLPLQAGRLA